MKQDFRIPAGLIGKFAVVKLWPELKTAEDECLARLKLAAETLGLECIEVGADGCLLSDSTKCVSKENVDFVLHLHYNTPKIYDAFSFVALWNPLRFYHEWGYARCSRNLTTHDDFISCASDAADDHVKRVVRNTFTHLPAKFKIFHSTPGVVHPPGLGDGKLFYAGINWEAVSGGKSRHQEVLKRLDKTGLLRIYGPEVFQGLRVWAGYNSYVKELPFDGISMVHEIAKAGIALVLSSQAHKDSGLMSSRLFESLAAGALIICDENPFARKFFGDTLLYIDSRATAEQTLEDIQGHLDWAHNNPDQALALIARAQEIFKREFTLTSNLSDLYNGLTDRKRELAQRLNPPAASPVQVTLHLLMPVYSEKILRTHIESALAQRYGNIKAVLVVDARVAKDSLFEIEKVLGEYKHSIAIRLIDFYEYGIRPEIKKRKRLGAVLQEILAGVTDADAFMVVAPNERLLSNHLSVLAGALQRSDATHCAATAAILTRDDEPVHGVHELIDFGHVDRSGPPGYGRFIFRMSSIPADIDAALQYLDGRPLASLIGSHQIDQQLPATVVIDITHEFPERTWDESAENEVLWAYCPGVFGLSTGYGPRPILASAVFDTPAAIRLGWLLSKVVSPRWVKAQFAAVRKQGLAKRVDVLKRKLGL